MQVLELIAEADKRARKYLRGIEGRPPFPSKAALDRLAVFSEPLPEHGVNAADTGALRRR